MRPRAQASGQTYEDRVAALSRAVGVLSDDIARVLAPLPASADSALLLR